MDQYKQEKKNSEITEDYFRVLEKRFRSCLILKLVRLMNSLLQKRRNYSASRP